MTALPAYLATVRAEAARYVATLTADWWAANGNPLAEGHFCETCNTRLDREDRACPFGCERTARLREVQRRAIVKVGGDLRFLGAAVVCGLAANA